MSEMAYNYSDANFEIDLNEIEMLPGNQIPDSLDKNQESEIFDTEMDELLLTVQDPGDTSKQKPI